MGMLVLFFVIPIIVGIIVAIVDKELFFTLLGFLTGLGLSLIWLFIAFIVGICIEKDYVYETKTTPICALGDVNGTKDSYFLGCGNSKSKMYYCYLTKEEDNSKVLHTIESDNIKIYDNEKENFRVETKYTCNSNSFINFFFLSFGEETSIYLPKGSISYNYQIILE